MTVCMKSATGRLIDSTIRTNDRTALAAVLSGLVEPWTLQQG